MQRLQIWTQDKTGCFLFSQLTHTLITLSVLALLLVGARQVGALNRVLAPVAQTMGDIFATFNYQGRLADSNGQPEDGTFAMSFAIYDAATDGNLIWGPEEHTVEVTDGLFSVGLGSKTTGGVPTSIWRGDRYLEITVNNEVLAPREPLRSAPHAMVAGEVLTVSSLDAPDGDPQDALVVDEDGNVGIGTSQPGFKLNVRGTAIVKGRNLDPKSDIDFSVLDRGLMIGWNRAAGRGEVDFISDRGGGDQGGFRFYDKDESDNLNFLMSIRGNGNVTVDGDFNVSGGSKSAVVETENYGERKLYAFEQPTNRFADEGVATLTDGLARVVLDPIFLETVEEDFHIHLTPYGDASLYVAEIGADYFVVESQEEGADVDFAWLLTATREGYEGVRLESGESK